MTRGAGNTDLSNGSRTAHRGFRQCDSLNSRRRSKGIETKQSDMLDAVSEKGEAYVRKCLKAFWNTIQEMFTQMRYRVDCERTYDQFVWTSSQKGSAEGEGGDIPTPFQKFASAFWICSCQMSRSLSRLMVFESSFPCSTCNWLSSSFFSPTSFVIVDVNCQRLDLFLGHINSGRTVTFSDCHHGSAREPGSMIDFFVHHDGQNRLSNTHSEHQMMKQMDTNHQRVHRKISGRSSEMISVHDREELQNAHMVDVTHGVI